MHVLAAAVALGSLTAGVDAAATLTVWNNTALAGSQNTTHTVRPIAARPAATPQR